MKSTEIMNEVQSVYGRVKGSDPVMMNKKLVMKDTLYRKSSPDRAIWHAECALDCNICVAAAAVFAVCVIVFALTWKICRIFTR